MKFNFRLIAIERGFIDDKPTNPFVYASFCHCHRNTDRGSIGSRLRPRMIWYSHDQRNWVLALQSLFHRRVGKIPVLSSLLSQDRSAAQPCRSRELRCPIPPIHYKISRLVHLRICQPKVLHLGHRQPLAEIFRADEWRIADDKLCRRPRRLSRIWIGFLAIDNLRQPDNRPKSARRSSLRYS